jgi:hypothetical protein
MMEHADSQTISAVIGLDLRFGNTPIKLASTIAIRKQCDIYASNGERSPSLFTNASNQTASHQRLQSVHCSNSVLLIVVADVAVECNPCVFES